MGGLHSVDTFVVDLLYNNSTTNRTSAVRALGLQQCHSRRIGRVPVHGSQQNCLSLEHRTAKDDDEGKVEECRQGRQ